MGLKPHLIRFGPQWMDDSGQSIDSKVIYMNRQEQKGHVEEIEGRIQEDVGRMTDDKTEQIKGRVKQARGKANQKIGKLRADLES